MENISAKNQQLRKYTLSDSVIFTGFASFSDAKQYVADNGGTLVEVAFTDGNDNPKVSEQAGLIEKELHFYVEAGAEYRFIHSADPEFREYADELQKIKSDADKNSLEEKYISNGEIEISEDPIIVLKDGKLESVTSRERSKYLKLANVYEIGVQRELTEKD